VSRWLLVAAMGVESLPFVRRLDRPRPLGPRLVVGRLGGHEVAVLTVGVGPDKAARRTRDALVGWTPDAVMSVGTCGALVAGLSIGDVRAADRLLADTRPVARLTGLGGLPRATVTTVSRACWTLEERDRLAAAGAQLVEMEAAAVWRAAQTGAPDVPFHALKVVSDHAGGAPDPAISDPGRPGAAAIARFKARALRLVERSLVPAVCAALQTAG
jgi:nucleoside phosphorylase